MVGTAIGSFLGVVIERSSIKGTRAKGQGLRAKESRSRCSACGHQLFWWENVPIVSFIFLKGKCRTCRSPIPYWLPLIELAGATAGAAVAAQIGHISLIGLMGLILVAAALIWIFFSDLVYGLIPDLAVAAGAVGAILSNLGNLSNLSYLAAAAAAAGFFGFLVLVTRGRGMGTGDVTLAAFLGLWLGWPKILLAVWLAFILGAVAGLVLIGLKLKRFGQTIPFGPFMIAGSIIAEIWGLTLLQLFLTI